VPDSLSQSEQAIIAACPNVQAMPANDLYPQASTKEDEQLQLLRVSNPSCTGVLALQGAQVLSFQPRQHPDLLWLSPNASLQTGSAIRGGIPLCLPWFGVNQRDPDKPKHGFARVSRWVLEQARNDTLGNTKLKLSLKQFGETAHPLFDYPFEAALEASFGKELTLELSVSNRSNASMPLSWALHSYHPVNALDEVTITGLQQSDYLDNTRDLEKFTQTGYPRFTGEFDRVYLNVGKQQKIISQPEISVSADNAPSAIVWNPGGELAANMTDLGANMHKRFICLERGAAFDNEQTLAPGATMLARITIA
jgi:glucose-6-phosphate 1-epimerase